MNNNRMDISKQLKAIVKNVYYVDPPMKQNMKFPCVIYKPNGFEKVFADNKIYRLYRYYDIQFISKTVDPDELKDLIVKLPTLMSGEEYTKDGLHYHNYKIKVLY